MVAKARERGCARAEERRGGEEVRAAAGDERTEGRAEELPLPLGD